jgi:glutamyl-tRNA reductase
MTTAGSGIRALVASAPAVPSAARHRLEAAMMPAARQHGGVVIRTCHRIEWYREATNDPLALLAATDAPIPSGTTTVSGLDAVERLISLTLGLDSIVLGEDQILHQVRSAVVEARASGPFGGELAFAFDVALHAGRLGRTWRPGRPISIADVGLARAVALVGEVQGRRVLVVGAGEMGRLAAGTARAHGAIVAIASRTEERSREVARTLAIDSWPLDPGEALADVAVVLIALGGPWSIRPTSVRALAAGPVVVDLSMPAALPEATAAALGRRHIGIDDLAGDPSSDDMEATPAAATTRYRERLVVLRDRTLDAFRDRAEARQAAGAAQALAATVERERRAALGALFRGRPDLEAGEQAAIEAMTVRLTDRLFGSALERLATDGDGPDGRAVREVFGL